MTDEPHAHSWPKKVDAIKEYTCKCGLTVMGFVIAQAREDAQ